LVSKSLLYGAGVRAALVNPGDACGLLRGDLPILPGTYDIISCSNKLQVIKQYYIMTHNINKKLFHLTLYPSISVFYIIFYLCMDICASIFAYIYMHIKKRKSEEK
jgi:hypothetical protein